MKKFYSILFSSLLFFSMVGSSFADIYYPPSDEPPHLSGPQPVTPPPPPIPTPLVDPESPDKLLPLDRLQEFKELTPTSLNPDITHGLPINLAGTLMTVTPLEKTMIVNNLPGAFDKGTVGAIALNDSAQHMLAVSEFTPVGAASQVGNNDNNNGIPEEENYDFIIPEAIVE